jgi:glyoxylase-like metal-dependent hydrolase (beta-lactamase superfamily II)
MEEYIMKHVSIAVLVSLISVGCSGDPSNGASESPGQPVPAAAPPRYETTEVAEGVYQFRFVGHNALFVVTDAGVVAFDPISVEAAAVYAEEIAARAPGVALAAIVYSHRDADHATGANVLREAFGAEVPIYGHENSVAPLVAAADPNLPPPDRTFGDRLSLADGAVELHYLGRSHSDDMAVALLPEHQIAFAVDFVAADRFGYQDLSSFYFPDMHDAIAGLLELPFQTIVFGHGPQGDRATIERQLQYYRDLDALVRAAVDAGLSEDETAARVLLEDYRDWARYDDWREMNVRGMYRKISTGTP